MPKLFKNFSYMYDEYVLDNLWVVERKDYRLQLSTWGRAFIMGREVDITGFLSPRGSRAVAHVCR